MNLIEPKEAEDMIPMWPSRFCQYILTSTKSASNWSHQPCHPMGNPQYRTVFIIYKVQWPFQEPIDWSYLPYIRPIFQAYVRKYPQNIWPYMVQYLHFRILKLPLKIAWLVVPTINISQPYSVCSTDLTFHKDVLKPTIK